jgi:response regulator RpfG family c-di-GMP phosphodiesterase
MPDVKSIQDKPLLLVVDDTPANLSLMNDLLGTTYRIKAANRVHGRSKLRRLIRAPI